MAEAGLFLLFPESEPCNQWMRFNGDLHDEALINAYVNDLTLLLDETNIENFEGFFDRTNVESFLKDFDILADLYPQPARRVFLSAISALYDWRDNSEQSSTTAYSIFNQSVADHTFCEVAQRNVNVPLNKHVIIDHASHTLGNNFTVSFDRHHAAISSVATRDAINHWFSLNRIPVRNFQVSPKHGENRQDIRTIGGEIISPLRCSREKAKELLETALGESIYELYNYDDQGYFIVYKFEGVNEQNMYHGYHVDLDSKEIPTAIKTRLLQRAGV